MTGDELRMEMDRLWRAAAHDASASSDPYLTLDRLSGWYRELDAPTRRHADDHLGEWLTSPDEAKRFDAVALIREFGVVEALAALRELSQRLHRSTNPGAPFEREKADRLIEELSDTTEAEL